MIQNMNLPLCSAVLRQHGGWQGLRRELDELGLDGVEGIWGGEPIPEDLPPGLLTGYHLIFFPDWLDFYRGDAAALRRKFGSLDAARAFYGGGPEVLLERYRADLERAMSLGARYVVFHVSDVSIEESYTYRWRHSDEEVLDASAELVNELLRGVPPEFDFLVENQWWPGFTFTKPDKTARLLDAISFERKGILLDIGHLMNSRPVYTQAQGAAFVQEMLDRHGPLCRYIRGVHLHQSLSCRYVRAHTGHIPDSLPEDYIEQFSVCYPHIQRIDRHRPWTHSSIVPVLEQIAPRYLTHELSGKTEAARRVALGRQIQTLQQGGLLREPIAASSD